MYRQFIATTLALGLILSGPVALATDEQHDQAVSPAAASSENKIEKTEEKLDSQVKEQNEKKVEKIKKREVQRKKRLEKRKEREKAKEKVEQKQDVQVESNPSAIEEGAEVKSTR